MKKFTILLVITTILHLTASSQPNFDECTIGVAHGSATEDGRPLLWKTRDYDSNHMGLKYRSCYDYNCIYIFDDTWLYFPTSGLNEHGLALVKTDVLDLTPAPTGPSGGDIKRYALGYCKTVDDFQAYLDSTNITGRRAVGNYAMIDSTGAAVIFEVGGYEYWRFDAQDEQNGYLIRTNFTVNGGGCVGTLRYNRSSDLLEALYSGDSLSHKNLIRYQFRDFSDISSQPYPVPYLQQANINVPFGYFDTHYSICNHRSTSTAVIQGILPGEKPELSTLWAMLGHPAASIASPFWPVGAEPPVTQSSLCDIALMIKEMLFDLPVSSRWINSLLLRDTIAGGLWTCTFPTEDYILDYAESFLYNWRGLDSVPVSEMLDLESELAEMVFDSLNFYYPTIGVETLVQEDEFSIYPNPAKDFLNIAMNRDLNINEIVIYNILGKEVFREIPVCNSINVSSLSTGTYVLMAFSSNERFIAKFIK